MQTSLVISTYNWPEALELCLKSLALQEVLPDEVLIADDGSGVETRDLIDRFKSVLKVPIHHIWHSDDGFRLAKIRNKAIAAAMGQYIIQIDGDLILHRKFISDHLRFALKGSFVRASRIYLSRELSQNLLSEKDIRFSRLDKGVSNKFSAFHLPLLWSVFEHKYKIKGAELYEIHGCNMAFWKSDAISVNGFNEDFKGWGPEDKEFVVRMLNTGILKRFIKLGALVFHVYHPEATKNYLSNNEFIFFDAIKNKSTFCKKGINQYISP